jgi:predicted permease
MPLFVKARSFLRNLFLSRRVELDLDEEVHSHLDMLVEENIRAGMPPEEAERAARIELGGIEQVKEQVREERIGNWLRSVLSDCRYAVRQLRKNPSFTAVTILTLAIGIGANAAIFSVVNSVLLHPLSYRKPEQLYIIRSIIPQLAKTYPSMPANVTGFRIWQRECQSFEQIAIADGGLKMDLTGSGEAEEIQGVRASSNLFDVLGVWPVIGRTFLPEEDSPRRDSVVILTDSFWRMHFHADPSLVGKTITLDGVPFEVVGILPSSFHFPKQLGALTRFGPQLNFFKPLGIDPANYQPFSDFNYAAIARLKPRVTADQALADLNVVQGRIAMRENQGIDLRASIIPLEAEIVGPSRRGLLLLLASVGAVLLIVCVNVANLTLARSLGRMREAAIRTALGASRGRLARQLLTENFLLAFASSLLGLAVAYVGLHWFIQSAPVNLPRLDEVRIDTRVLASALLVSGLTGVLFGVLPAWRFAGAGPQETLKSSVTTTTESGRTRRLREVLITLEVGLSTILVILAGLLASSLVHVLHVNAGFAIERVLAADIQLPPKNYSEPAARVRFFDQVLAGARALPGVRSAAWVDALPLSGEGTVSALMLPQQKMAEAAVANYRAVSVGYFETAGIALVNGRFFAETDLSRNLVIISQSVAKSFWPGESAVGKTCVTTWGGLHQSEVIGVVADVRTVRLEAPPPLMVYLPMSYGEAKPGPPASASIVLRTSTDPSGTAGAVRELIHRTDPDVPVVSLRPMTQVVSDSIEGRRFQIGLASLFAAFGLLLASLGIFGVIAYSVEQRRHELGIRMALGAQTSQLRRMVLRQGMAPVGVGLSAGLGISLLVGHVIQGFLFGVNTSDPVTIISVVFLVTAVGLGACYIPARRATRIDPMIALRYE